MQGELLRWGICLELVSRADCECGGTENEFESIHNTQEWTCPMFVATH